MNLGETISLLVGIIGTAVSIYQWAVINANKRKLGEVQYLLAGIHKAAVQNQISWANQLNLLSRSENEKDKESIRIHIRARDDCTALATLASTLEGAIDTEFSAIKTINDRILDQTKLSNLIQEEVRKSPPPSITGTAG